MNHVDRLLSCAALAACVCLGGAARAADKPNELLKPAPDAKPSADAPPAAPVPPSPIRWTKHRLSDAFHSEGAAAGDFNKDGKMDVVSGPFWYAGGDFASPKRHQYYAYTDKDGKPQPPTPFDPVKYSDNFLAFAHDFNGDGWDDILIYGFPGKDASWFENPKDPAATGPWTRHVALGMVDNESPAFADVNGDGRPDIVCMTGGQTKDGKPNPEGGQLGYATYDPANPTQRWTFHAVSPKTKGYQRFTHGLGVGDVNGDGRMDLLEKDGWWEQPAAAAGGAGSGDTTWKKHDAKFGAGGAQMFAYDVNGDGRNDVITSLQAHMWGLAWFEQKADGSFQQHVIMSDKAEANPQRLRFSQMHAIDLADIDGDGIKDVVTGKRYWAHGPKGDAEPAAPAVLYWFRLTRTGGTPTFTGYEIDNDSGVGTQVMAVDVNGDKRLDVVVGNKKGTFVHVQQPAQQTSRRD